MVGVRISGPRYQTVLQRLQKRKVHKFYLEMVCEFDTKSGAGGNFKTKKEKLGPQKRKFLLFYKKRTLSQYVFATSNPNMGCRGQ